MALAASRPRGGPVAMAGLHMPDFVGQYRLERRLVVDRVDKPAGHEDAAPGQREGVHRGVFDEKELVGVPLQRRRPGRQHFLAQFLQHGVGDAVLRDPELGADTGESPLL